MTADEIVAALASAPEPFAVPYCLLCRRDVIRWAHAKNCPWFMAQRWKRDGDD